VWGLWAIFFNGCTTSSALLLHALLNHTKYDKSIRVSGDLEAVIWGMASFW